MFSRQIIALNKRLGGHSVPSLARTQRIPRRMYNFASHQYASCFGNLPSPNVERIRQHAITYLEQQFDRKIWFQDPVVTLLNGTQLRNGTETDTVDAFGRVNGRIIHANPAEVEQVIQHVTTYQSPYVDLRAKLTRIEEELLTDHVGFLIGNQGMDFQKQDGVTEIEEAIMANEVERRMNGKSVLMLTMILASQP